MIYHAFFHSVITYGIIAWSGAYASHLYSLQRLQNRLLKIINRNKFVQNNPMYLEQLFALESLSYYYDIMKEKYCNSKSVTRNKNILIPKCSKAISNKNSYINAIKLFNRLPIEYKTLDITKFISKRKIKEWILENIL